MNKRIDVFHTICCSGYIYYAYIYIMYIVYNTFYLLVVLTTVYIYSNGIWLNIKRNIIP